MSVIQRSHTTTIAIVLRREFENIAHSQQFSANNPVDGVDFRKESVGKVGRLDLAMQGQNQLLK